MGGIITDILTDAGKRDARSVQDSLILHAEAGKAWGPAKQ
jgi:hypothetical protein